MRLVLTNIIAIYRKELQGYFTSPLAMAVAGIFWLIAGFFFVTILLDPQRGILAQVAAQAAMEAQMGVEAPPLDVPYEFMQFFLSTIASLSLFILPILSMGLYAEERKRGTLELLATSPLYNWTVAVGKLLGVATFYATLTAPLLLYEAITFSSSEPLFPPTIPLLGHLGLILLATSILSLGMFISSLTDNTILSAILTFGLVLFLWIINLIAENIGGTFGNALGHLSLLDNYNNLIQGIVDTSSIILFASYIFLGIFLTAQSIEAFRFQR
ncbi:MAG: ABC transporter permease subunit [Cyanobacteria bacterium SID2]|nr:ABC transporter permease subunit [Cyanobacteria bacterium SID2]MBP0004846.1 ABC transporter permease subunit [Cyanobacteria bacterium SBC]